MNKDWKLSSWKNKPAKHLPIYKDEAALESVLKKISRYPPLVFAGEARNLEKQLAEVVNGRAFFTSRRRLRRKFY